ncbi:hypothetical protein SFRURICE_020905 [Spodoptera frugiperda]|uniref:SFRICE_014412 n=1 Tax=Spodoptera frugiperda TaxID=7108 RepID=A0A2H1X0J7_SPOFR|nr:hypothetical protein SFRURICE_020905 [Spodoptera frugiperda]
MTLLSTSEQSSSSTSDLLDSRGDPPGLSRTSRLLITGVHCWDNLPSLTRSLRLPRTGVAWAETPPKRPRRVANGLPSQGLLGLVLHSEWRHRASKFASSTDTLVCSPLGCVVRMVCFAMLQPCRWTSSRLSILCSLASQTVRQTDYYYYFFVDVSKGPNSLSANRKLLKANPPLMSVTGDHHVSNVLRNVAP